MGCFGFRKREVKLLTVPCTVLHWLGAQWVWCGRVENSALKCHFFDEQ